MGNDTKRRLALAAAFLVAATAGSRLLGLVREIVMGSSLGLENDTGGAFTVANKIPSLVRTLLADTALSAAFIPVFSGLLQKERRREAWQLAFTVTVVATGVLGLITILGMVFAPQVIKVLASGADYNTPEMIALMAHLMRIMFPTVVILGIAGILMGILNSYDHFTMPALAPIVWNVIIIGVVLAFSNYGVKALAWGVFAGTVVELVIQIPAVWRRRWRPGMEEDGAAGSGQMISGTTRPASFWRLDLRNPDLRRVGVLLGPVIISLGVINFNSFIDTMIATRIHLEGNLGAPAIIEKAFRLFQLPQGVFAIAIGTVLFPAFSRHALAKRMKEFRDDLSTGLRQIFFVTLPFAAFFAVLGVPTVRLIFQYGKVTPAGTELIASALMFFSVGMAFVSVNTLLNRAFYSIQKPWLPLVTGVLNLALNLVLDLLLYKPLGVGGITLSTSIVSLVNFFALMFLLSPRIGGVDTRRVAWSAARSIIALVPLAGVAYGVWWGLDTALGRSLWAQIVSVCVAYTAGGVVYCLAAWALRMPELRDVVSVIRRRREPRATEEVIDLGGGE
jgi:putative peptidoglycan lipid II flippase